jgi:hypothetical protein
MGVVARPSALTPKLRERIESELADGTPIAIVAQREGLGRSTLHEWIANGRVTRRRRRDPLKLAPEIPAEERSSSTDSLEERLRDAESGLVAAIVRASQRGSWQAAAWLLERSAPERWAKPSRTRALEIERVPLAEDPFAEIDQLAARRKRKAGR